VISAGTILAKWLVGRWVWSNFLQDEYKEEIAVAMDKRTKSGGIELQTQLGNGARTASNGSENSPSFKLNDIIVDTVRNLPNASHSNDDDETRMSENPGYKPQF
jgi:hypothetical protein